MAVIQQSVVLFKEPTKSSLDQVPIGDHEKTKGLKLYIMWQKDATSIDPRLFLMLENTEDKAAHCTIDAYLTSRQVTRKFVAKFAKKIDAKEKDHVYLGSHADFKPHCFTKSQLKNESVKRVMAEFIFHFENVKWEK